jgi:predicted alpha/beta-fold hydrolase
LRFYHSGAWEDLARVVDHAARRGVYSAIALVGFSVGGNLTLLYLGRLGAAAHPQVCGAVVFSVPCDLASSAHRLAHPANRIYMTYFLRSLHAKIKAKMATRPGGLDDRGFGAIRTFADFDNRYTAPLNGFADAADYWRRCSSRPVLLSIRRPTLMISAADDPFLAPPCYPVAEARANPFLSLEVPPHGGHVGFMAFNPQRRYWSEWRTGRFLGRIDSPASV